MHFVHVDDSRDDAIACFSALILPAMEWQACLDFLVGLRRQLRVSDGIYTRKEIHARDWVSGRGDIGVHSVPKGGRVRLFEYILSGVCRMPGVRLLNAASPTQHEERTFERMLNRINVFMKYSGSHAVVFSDEGKNYDHLLRRMRRFNMIPSAFQAWSGGGASQNIPVNLILEDIVYRDSARSLFIQMADCCAYALLRRENPLPSKTAYGLDRSWFILEPIMVKQAYRSDPYGVIR